ncbi:MAG: zinc finger HIT domain-containing protein [Halanaeroarchaeum sp.]
MSVEGLCHVCERGPARYACERCGSLVCENHYDRETGLCSGCAQSSKQPPDHVDSGDDVLR